MVWGKNVLEKVWVKKKSMLIMLVLQYCYKLLTKIMFNLIHFLFPVEHVLWNILCYWTSRQWMIVEFVYWRYFLTIKYVAIIIWSDAFHLNFNLRWGNWVLHRPCQWFLALDQNALLCIDISHILPRLSWNWVYWIC